MNFAAGLVLAFVVAAGGRERDLGAVSANGRYEARIARAPGQERVADRLARRLLTVRATAADPAGEPLWSCAWPGVPGEGGHYLLADDGATFVAVAADYQLARPVVRVFRFGDSVAEYNGRDVDLERGQFAIEPGHTRWLADPGDRLELAWRDRTDGPSLVLELESQRGWKRELDLTQGGFIGQAPLAAPVLAPGVDPKLRGVVRVPRVTGFTIPERTLAGQPAVIHVEGVHPTTNWQLCGFTVEPLDAEGFELRIVPQTRPPTPASVVGQAITAFQGEATLYGLQAGRYSIHVEGSEPQELRLPARTMDVLPSRLRARLRITGGIAGVDETIEVFVPGVVRRTSARAAPDEPPLCFQLAPERREEVDRALVALAGERPTSETTPRAADLFQYAVEWWNGETWLHVERDDGTARGAVGELILAVRRAAR